MDASLIGIMAIAVFTLVAVGYFRFSAKKRPCPACHAMMPMKQVKCPRCGKAIPLHY